MVLNKRRLFSFRLRKKKKEPPPPLTREDLAGAEQRIGRQVDQKVGDLKKLQTMTPRQRLRMMKLQIRKTQKPRRV